MIEVEGVTKRFGSATGVEAATFRAGKGEIVGLVGPSGAGKTTMLRLLACYYMPTTGRIRIGGHDTSLDSMEARRLIGYLPEKEPLYPEMTVREFLNFRTRLKGMKGRRRSRRIREMIARCGLVGLDRALMGRLSRGEARRVLVADCLAASPPVVLMDEPTLGLDPANAERVRALIGRGTDEHCVVFASHNLEEVEALCSRLLVMSRGRIVADDSPSGLKQRFGVLRLADAVAAFAKGGEVP